MDCNHAQGSGWSEPNWPSRGVWSDGAQNDNLEGNLYAVNYMHLTTREHEKETTKEARNLVIRTRRSMTSRWEEGDEGRKKRILRDLVIRQPPVPPREGERVRRVTGERREGRWRG